MTLTLAQTSDDHVVLEGVSWEFYQRMLDEIGDGRTRLTYDNGRLEIMSPSGAHDQIKTVIARLIEAYGDETGISVQGIGSTTFKVEELRKGLEPDECYYVQRFEAIVGKENIDLTIDPPDLAVEVDIFSRSVPRQPIYAALGVPEIWRYHDHAVTSLHRTIDGRYVQSAQSLAFPNLPLDIVSRLVSVGLSKGQPAAVRELKQWIRGGSLS
jgi:Uma2 family endonuclease